MSLKAFHLFFMTVSLVFSIAFGLWAFRAYRADGQTMNLVLSVASMLFAALLIPYGIWFLKKLRNVSYI